MVDILKVREQARKKKSASKKKSKKKKGKKKATSVAPVQESSTPEREEQKSAKSSMAEQVTSPANAEDESTGLDPVAAVEGEPDPTGEDTEHSVEAPSAVDQARARLERFLEAEADARSDQTTEEIQADEELGRELLTFELGGEHFAIPVVQLVEIVVPRSPTRVPNSPPAISGLISLRGSIVTLVDLRRLLDLPLDSRETLDSRIVILSDGEDMIGFPVDRVWRVSAVRDEEITDHPEVIDGELSSLFRGVFTQNEHLVALLDVSGVATSAAGETRLES